MSARRQLPDLRLVRSESIQFHERPEGRRTTRLTERLRREKVLRNPPIVAGIEAERCMLLDGANRVTACREIGYSHIPVQWVEYGSPDIQLKGWHHLLLEGAGLDLRSAYAAIPGVRLTEVRSEQLLLLLAARHVYAVLVDARGTFWGLFPTTGHCALDEWIAVLHRVVDAYEGRSKVERIKWADDAELLPAYESLEHQIVLFPTLQKAELLQLAATGTMIPTGISRHLVPGRALGLNLELEFLSHLGSERELQEHFEAFVRRLEVEGRIRFYEEPVFILNE